MSVADYLGCVKFLLEDLVLASRLVTVNEMNIYVFCDLRLEFRSFTTSLYSRATLVSLEDMADLLGTQEFAHANEFSPAVSGLALVVN